MTIVESSVVADWVAQLEGLQGEERVCISLKDGFLKIFRDGESSLVRENRSNELNLLHLCKTCSECNETEDVSCIDMDAFVADLRDGECRSASVDIILLIKNVGSEGFTALCVEGKLGVVYNDRPRNPTKGELIKKFTDTKKCLNTYGVEVLEDYYILVSKATYEQQRYRANRWNKGSREFNFCVECCSKFLLKVGVLQDSSRLKCKRQSRS